MWYEESGHVLTPSQLILSLIQVVRSNVELEFDWADKYIHSGYHSL